MIIIFIVEYACFKKIILGAWNYSRNNSCVNCSQNARKRTRTVSCFFNQRNCKCKGYHSSCLVRMGMVHMAPITAQILCARSLDSLVDVRAWGTHQRFSFSWKRPLLISHYDEIEPATNNVQVNDLNHCFSKASSSFFHHWNEKVCQKFSNIHRCYLTIEYTSYIICTFMKFLSDAIYLREIHK